MDVRATKTIMDSYNKKRERTDKISALMGDYLLRGYCMLGTCCPVCGTVLLKFKDNEEFCVACNEVDAKPVTVLEAASNLTQALSADKMSPPPRETVPPCKPVSESVKQEFNIEGFERETICSAVKALHEKIAWTSQALQASTSVEDSIRLCDLMKSSADALHSLMLLQKE